MRILGQSKPEGPRDTRPTKAILKQLADRLRIWIATDMSDAEIVMVCREIGGVGESLLVPKP